MVGLMAATTTYIIFIISLLFISINNSVNIINDASGFFHSGKSSDDFKLYENTKLKFSIQYPSTWQKEERTE